MTTQGKIIPWYYRDNLTGNEIEITVSHIYTTIRVNERCYYFRAEDGVFDGTSTDMSGKLSQNKGEEIHVKLL